MQNKSTESIPTDQKSEQPQQLMWQRATLEDLQKIDFEKPIVDSNAAEAHELSDLFCAAIERAESSDAPLDSPGNRVFLMLTAITGMYFKPDDVHEPFGPMAVFADGRRSAMPRDFSEGDRPSGILGRKRHKSCSTCTTKRSVLVA
jgi:hypothetical protein